MRYLLALSLSYLSNVLLIEDSAIILLIVSSCDVLLPRLCLSRGNCVFLRIILRIPHTNDLKAELSANKSRSIIFMRNLNTYQITSDDSSIKKGKYPSLLDISAIILLLLLSRASFRFSPIFFRYADDAHRRIVQTISFHLTILYYYVSSDTVIVAANRRVRENRKENRWRNR